MARPALNHMASQESKVSGIVNALHALEGEIDSLHARVPDMQKTIQAKTQSELASLMDRTMQMAAQEAESIIQDARSKAEAEAKRISEESKSHISEIVSKIQANFDDAVMTAVSTILKA